MNGEVITDEQLVALAKEAMSASYSPYSGFRVGAALLTADEAVFQGANIENMSFGATNCAERTAIFKAVSEGYRDFSAIAIAGGSAGIVTEACYPCGICRQVMSEFCKPGFRILLATADGYEIHTLEELLPGTAVAELMN